MAETFPEGWNRIERSLACAAEGKRLSDESITLRERSRRLREQSAELSRHNRTLPSIFDRQNGFKRKGSSVEKLRLAENSHLSS